MPSDCMLLPWSSAQQFDAYQLKTESFRPNLYIYDYNPSSSATTPSSEEPDSESTSAESPTCSRLNNSFEDAKLQYVDERRYTESPGFKLKASEQPHHSKWREHLHHRADFRKRRKLDQPKLVEPKSGRIHKILSQDTLDQLERRRKVKSSKRDENSNIVQLKDRLDPSSPIGRICLLDEEAWAVFSLKIDDMGFYSMLFPYSYSYRGSEGDEAYPSRNQKISINTIV